MWGQLPNRATGVLATALVLAICSFGRADVLPRAVVSEVMPRGGGAWPAYIELTLLNMSKPFDLVVLQAAPERTEQIEAVFTVTPGPWTEVVLLHEGTWPRALPASTQALGVDDLELAASAMATSRRLVVLDGVLSTEDQASPPPIENWAGHGDLPAVLDVVTWLEPGWAVEPLSGETVWEPAVGGGLFRSTGAALDFPDQFTALTAGQLTDSTQAVGPSPGWVNPVAGHMPEPGAGLLLAVACAGLTLGRRGR